MTSIKVSAERLNYEIDEALPLVKFVVEASSFERQALWKQWEKRINWEEQTRGWWTQAGKLDNRPVGILISIARLNGHLILFYEAVSQVVDHAQIDEWFKRNCWPMWDRGTRRAHCNATNFHHCLGVVCK